MTAFESWLFLHHTIHSETPPPIDIVTRVSLYKAVYPSTPTMPL